MKFPSNFLDLTIKFSEKKKDLSHFQERIRGVQAMISGTSGTYVSSKVIVGVLEYISGKSEEISVELEDKQEVFESLPEAVFRGDEDLPLENKIGELILIFRDDVPGKLFYIGYLSMILNHLLDKKL